MIRFLTILFIASPALWAAGSPELLIAIRHSDYAQVSKLLALAPTWTLPTMMEPQP